MVNRLDRDRMIGLIESNLKDPSKCEEKWKMMAVLVDVTNDESLKLCYQYWVEEFDDMDLWEGACDDVYGWNVAQRVLLFFHSDEELECVTQWKWSMRQIGASVLLVAWFIWAYFVGLEHALFKMGWIHIFMSAALSGLWSWEYRERNELWGRFGDRAKLSQPFGNFREMLRVRRKVKGFKKKSLILKEQKLRLNWLMHIGRVIGYLVVYSMITWALISLVWLTTFCMPVILLVGMMPTRVKGYRLQGDSGSEVMNRNMVGGVEGAR
ncbi:hypothetical protein JD969_19240 [Planctomycetota bacterium]|nr:hypothetical protein JD969_19240 [Planctomycetota bacterium]